MFIRLGILGIVRQLSRSTLALVSLVLAAVSLTASLTISSGYPALAFSNYRDYLGGDLVVYPVRIMTSPSEQGSLQLYRLPRSDFSTLTTLYPHVSDVGFLSASPPVSRPLSATDLSSIVDNPQVAAVNPLYRMPAWRELAGANLPTTVRALREQDPLQNYLVEQVSPQLPAGEIPVWLNSKLPPGHPLPVLGQQIALMVPNFIFAPDGSLQIDDTSQHSLTVRVAGFYAIPTREIVWPDGQGGMQSEQGWFDLDEVWMNQPDWQSLWQLAAPGQPIQAFSYGVRVKNMGVLESVTGELQVNNPDLTIVSAPNLAKLAANSPILDHFTKVPDQFIVSTGKPQLGLPQDMGKLLALFIYINAGLLMAARMLTGAAARRKEIGILKAIGARRRDVMVMALTEAVVLSIIGSTIGFLLTYSAALVQQLTNHVTIVSILLDLVRNYGLVFGETVAIGLVFGLLPAWRLSKLTVSEVLRS